MAVELSENHKRFIQSLLRQPVMSMDEMKEKYKLCFNEERAVDNREVEEALRTVNSGLRLAYMMVKPRVCEVTGKEYYVLFNTSTLSATKLCTDFTAIEIVLFKKILKEIVLSSEGSVSSIDCMNFSDDIPRMSKTDAQRAIDKFVRAKWLVEASGTVMLGVRSLVELDPVIRQVDDGIGDCKLCKSLIVKGPDCSRCGVKIHRRCLDQMSRRRDPRCPSCNQPWESDSNENGSTVEDEDEDEETISQVPPKRRRNRASLE